MEIKHIFPLLGIKSSFVLLIISALSLIYYFNKIQCQSIIDIINPNNSYYPILIILFVFVFTLLTIKVVKKDIMEIIIIGILGCFIGLIFYIIFINFIVEEISSLLSIAITIFLVISLLKYPEWYVINIFAIISGIGVCVFFGIILDVIIVVVILIVVSLYDIISVYKTKNMIEFTSSVMDLKLPLILVIPKTKSYSLINVKNELSTSDMKNAYLIGLGDIVLPGMLIVSCFSKNGDLLMSLFMLIGMVVGLSALLIFVVRGKPQAGLPYISIGALVGYIIYILGY